MEYYKCIIAAQRAAYLLDVKVLKFFKDSQADMDLLNESRPAVDHFRFCCRLVVPWAGRKHNFSYETPDHFPIKFCLVKSMASL